MSAKGVSNSRRRSRRRIKRGTRLSATDLLEAMEGWPSRKQRPGLKVHHFAGISLAGGKTDKTCLAIVEYYPNQNKIFLSRLFERIRSREEVSADLQLHRLLAQGSGKLESVAFDVPLQLPKCIRCELKCPGFEVCDETEIKWMWNHYRKFGQKRRPKRLFTPYTQRCVELHLATELEEVFHLPHAMGSNVAPLTARAHFLVRRLETPAVEVYPRLSVWRIGRSLQLAKSHLFFHKHSVDGEENRRLFLTRLVERNLAFLYDQDLKSMAENNQAFEAFIVALTAVLQFRGQCEPRPRDFPPEESWLAIPSPQLKW